MKKEELMIGDLVKAFDGQSYKITDINTLEKGSAVRLRYDENIVDTWTDRIGPIHLTEEILKSNGFESTGQDDPIWYLPNALFNLEEIDGEFVKDVCGETVTFRYVHQLQHAFRLCGMDEIADKFKIG